jgi:membrane protease YdiL (CAAX protease family)
LSLFLTALAAYALSFYMDRMCEARGLLPPGFRQRPARRLLGWILVGQMLWMGVLASLASFGEKAELDLSRLTTPQLFLLHGLLVLTVVLWFLLGFAGVRPPPAPPPPLELLDPVDPILLEEEPVPVAAPAPPPVPLFRQFLAQFGFVAPSVPREIGVGVLVGIGSWGAVLAVAIFVGLLLMALGAEEALPKEPPALIPWIAALPVGVRILISLSAGVVEETFFRGFLQPRIGIALSSALFILAHFSYGQPLMLVGIGTLSLIYAFLVRWRQNLWPAIAAHFLFDAVQLLFIIPFALKYMEKAAPGN